MHLRISRTLWLIFVLTAALPSAAQDSATQRSRNLSAEATARRAVGIRELRQKEDPTALGAALIELGVVLSELERLDESVATDRRAIDFLEVVPNRNHGVRAAAYSNLATAYKKLGRLD